MQYARQKNTGLTLIEMLVVVAIIVIMTAIAVPTFVRTGFTLTGRVNLAAQEYYTLLKAAQVYATSNNIETAVVYIVTPTFYEDERIMTDSVTGAIVPVVKTMLIARRLTQEEAIELATAFGTIVQPESGVNFSFTDTSDNGELGPIMIPLAGVDGTFRDLPNDTCILPELFAVTPGTTQSRTGLSKARIYAPGNEDFLRPGRHDSYNPTDKAERDYDYSFAAHRFTPEGAFVADESGPQRALVRVGRFPDSLEDQRFSAPLDPNFQDTYELLYDPSIAALDEYIVYIDPTFEDDPDEDPNASDDFHRRRNTLELDRQLELYFSTGRVKVLQ